MSVEIMRITKNNLPLVAKGATKFGMPRSARWLERCLYDPTVDDLLDSDIRGHMAVKDGEDVVAIQCYYYIPFYFRDKKLLMTTGCIMGADKKYGEWLLCCLDKNRETQNPGALGIGNCISSKRSAKICKVYHKLKEAPPEARQTYLGVTDLSFYPIYIFRKFLHLPLLFQKIVWHLLRPFAVLSTALSRWNAKRCGYKIVRYNKIEIDKFGRFWKRRLADNDGVITSRDPMRLAWLFDDSLAAGTVSILTAEKNGEIEGYALIRRYPREDGFFNRHSLYDICAIKDNEETLKVLVRSICRLAGNDYGSFMMYVGAIHGQDRWLLPYMHRRLKTDYSMIFYGSKDREIMESISQGKGWFLGPMDGERSLGHGGYIDL